MAKVTVCPAIRLILSHLVERMGHMQEKHAQDGGTVKPNLSSCLKEGDSRDVPCGARILPDKKHDSGGLQKSLFPWCE